MAILHGSSSGYDGTLGRLVERAATRLERVIATDAPRLAHRGLGWLSSLSRTGRLADYFKHPRRFPMLLLPWWSLEGAEPDVEFLEDVAYGTMAGYCYVRLVDDLVDAQEGTPLELLPLTALLHSEFHGCYLRHFPAESPFWPVFREVWLRSADAMIAVDPRANPVPETLIERATATIGAVVIPLYAVMLRAGRSDRFPAWREVTLELARLEQQIDDLVDWLEDWKRGLPNVLIAAATTRARPGESVMSWVVREGYRWGLDAAVERATRARILAEHLGSEPLLGFVADRVAAIELLRRDTEPGLAALALVAATFESTDG